MDREKTEKYRHELKYQVTDGELRLIRARLAHLIPLDAHAGEKGKYTIRSLYFDDYDDTCLMENINGTDPREKFRIRIYNHDTRRIQLECQRKERGKTLKTACPLTEEQARLLVAGKTLPLTADQPPLLRKLLLQMRMRGLKPVVIVEYDRIPYVCKNGNVRVTLDTNIGSSRAVADFFAERISKRPVLPAGQQLLEVKYDAYLPDVIYRSLQLPNLRQTAFSKYAICRKYTR